LGLNPARPRAPDRAMEKHPAWAAPMILRVRSIARMGTQSADGPLVFWVNTALSGWITTGHMIPTGSAEERVVWRVADVRDVPPRDMDFIYVYRPLHPVGPGDEFYRRFAATLEAGQRPCVVFSIADCLRDYLSSRFDAFYSDGHLTCFRGPL